MTHFSQMLYQCKRIHFHFDNPNLSQNCDGAATCHYACGEENAPMTATTCMVLIANVNWQLSVQSVSK